MLFEVCTGRISYAQSDALNITQGAVWRAQKEKQPEPEGAIFAPPRWMVQGFKRRELDSFDYTVYYRDMMRYRYAQKPHLYHELLKRRVERGDQRIVLTCYCDLNGGTYFCHRTLARDILVKLGNNAVERGIITGIEFVEGEEISSLRVMEEELLEWHDGRK